VEDIRSEWEQYVCAPALFVAAVSTRGPEGVRGWAGVIGSLVEGVEVHPAC
jgi:hypothetical protein